MAKPSAKSDKPNLPVLLAGLTYQFARLAGLLAFLLLLLLSVPAIIASLFLDNPWHALGLVGLIALAVLLAAHSLVGCFRLAKTPEQLSKLKIVALWFVLAVLAVIMRLGEFAPAEMRFLFEVAICVCLYFALTASLDLVTKLLTAALPTSPTPLTSTGRAGTTP